MIARAFAIAFARPRAALWTLLLVACAFVAAGVAGLSATNVERWTTPPAGAASMVVYLGEGVDDAHAQALAGQVGKLPGVERAELVPPAETAHRLQAALGADSALLEGVELASLPASIEVGLAPGVKDVIAMSPVMRELRAAPGVVDVTVEDAADPSAGTLRTVRTATLIGAALLGALAVIVVFAAIRVRLERDPREQRVLYLMGASPAFSIAPTALAGALHGLVAALLAAGALGIALLELPVVAVAPAELAIFLAAGLVLGGLGGSLAGAARA